MNKLAKILCTLVLVFTLNGFANAQTLKIAHVNTSEVMNVMPERTSAEKALQDYYTELQNQLQVMATEYQNKLKDYEANQATMSNLVKQSKEKEIADLGTRIQEFQGNAEGEFENKRMELMAPLLEKIQNAINTVGKEKGYTYVLDLATGSVVYVGTGAIDITPEVKAKLGIK
jgi:Outer membrane protein